MPSSGAPRLEPGHAFDVSPEPPIAAVLMTEPPLLRLSGFAPAVRLALLLATALSPVAAWAGQAPPAAAPGGGVVVSSAANADQLQQCLSDLKAANVEFLELGNVTKEGCTVEGAVEQTLRRRGPFDYQGWNQVIRPCSAAGLHGLHSSGSPAFRRPSNEAGRFGVCSFNHLIVIAGLRRRASARAVFASSILPACAYAAARFVWT